MNKTGYEVVNIRNEYIVNRIKFEDFLHNPGSKWFATKAEAGKYLRGIRENLRNILRGME